LNQVMIELTQQPVHARPHRRGRAVATLAAGNEIDDWLRARLGPPPIVEPGIAEKCAVPESVTKRARRLLAARINFIGNPSFDDVPAVARILGPTPEPDGDEGCRPEEAHGRFSPTDPKFGLSRLLSREQEVHLFRKMNFLKYAAIRLREAIDPDTAVVVEINRVEILLQEATAILDRIIGSNMALVLSIVKKYRRPGEDIADLVSDGNLSLWRAAVRFDFARGFRFSTYATRAIMNDCVLRIRREAARHHRIVTYGPELFRSVADRREGEPPDLALRQRSNELLRSLLGHLNARERTIIDGRFGFTDKRQTLAELGTQLGISKERVRQIEIRALRKLQKTDLARSLATAAWNT
jgi:RNA polymerase primary sigma factor